MKVIAHRGASQVAPENTVPAIRRAIRDGADAIEIDVQMTKDGKVIVFHDEWLNRTTNGNGFICDRTYTYIQSLDAGSWFNPAFKGTKVPLFADLLKRLRAFPVELHIELKNHLIPYQGMEEKVIRIIHDTGWREKAIISSFRADSLATCRQIDPSIRLGLLCWDSLDELIQRKEWQTLNLYSVHPHISLLNPNVQVLKRNGIKLFPYVVRNRKHLHRCMQYQADGFFTNSPRQAKLLLRNS